MNTTPPTQFEPHDHEHVDAEPSSSDELDAVRTDDVERSLFRTLCDPILRVCYPMVKPVREILDPIQKVCYPPLIRHWETKYRMPHKRLAPWVLVFDVFLLFVLGALVVTLIFIRAIAPALVVPDTVSVTLTRSQTLIAGEETTFVFRYEQMSDSAMTEGQLIVDLPPSFTFLSSEPVAVTETVSVGTPTIPNRRIIRLGDIPAFGSGEVRMTGIVSGDIGSMHTIHTQFTSLRAGEAQPIRVPGHATFTVDAVSMAMDVSFDGPLVIGGVVPLHVSYRHEGMRALHDASVRIVPPPGFVLTGSVPNMTANGVWNIGDIMPGDTGRITVYGYMTGGAAPSFLAQSYADIQGMQVMIAEVLANANSESTGFVVSHDVPSLPRSISAGSTVDVTVRYSNHGTEPMTDVRLSIIGDERFIASELPVWDSSTHPELARVMPGESGLLTASLLTVSSITPDMLVDTDSAVLSFGSVAEYRVASAPTMTLRGDGGMTDIPFTTSLGVHGAAMYMTAGGDQIGIGPMPPVPGETTRLWVMLRLTTGSGAARNVRVTARLPESVEWTRRMSVAFGDPIAFLPNDREIVWRIGSVPAFAEYVDVVAHVELEITPPDAESALTLLRDIVVVGEDARTGAPLRAVLGGVGVIE